MAYDDFYVRRFKERDLLQCVDILEWLVTNSRYTEFGTDRDSVARHLMASLNKDSNIYCEVAINKTDKKVMGYLHGYIDTPYFTTKKQGGDFALVILPKYRRYAPKVLRRLMDDFEKWAKANGAYEVMMGATTGSDSTGYRKFLEKRGYSPTGYAATKEI